MDHLSTDEFRMLIRTASFDETLAFWEGALGLERVGGWERDDSTGAVLGTGGNAVVVIYASGTGTYDFPPPQNVDAGIKVDDVDALYERLRAAGVDVPDPPEDQAWGLRSIRVVDPNGVPVYLFTPVGE